MPDEHKIAREPRTYLVDADDFEFETLEQENGRAVVVRFKLDDPYCHVGDLLLVLSGAENQFHGLIDSIEDGYAIASDRKGSQLMAATE